MFGGSFKKCATESNGISAGCANAEALASAIKPIEEMNFMVSLPMPGTILLQSALRGSRGFSSTFAGAFDVVNNHHVERSFFWIRA